MVRCPARDCSHSPRCSSLTAQGRPPPTPRNPPCPTTRLQRSARRVHCEERRLPSDEQLRLEDLSGSHRTRTRTSSWPSGSSRTLLTAALEKVSLEGRLR